MSPSKWRIRRIFRPAIQRMAVPLINAGVPPNTVTLLSLFLAILATLSLLLTGIQSLYGILVFIVGLLDGLDGAIARGGGHKTDYGAFLDSVVDKIAETVILLGIALTYLSDAVLGLTIPIWVILCIAGWTMTSFTRCRADSLGVKDLDIGPGGRSERLFVLVIFAVLSLILWGLVIVTLLGVATAGYRVIKYGEELSHNRTSHS